VVKTGRDGLKQRWQLVAPVAAQHHGRSANFRRRRSVHAQVLQAMGKNGRMSDEPVRHFKLDQVGAEALAAYDAKWIHDQFDDFQHECRGRSKDVIADALKVFPSEENAMFNPEQITEIADLIFKGVYVNLDPGPDIEL
jgi:hypothetical protein